MESASGGITEDSSTDWGFGIKRNCPTRDRDDGGGNGRSGDGSGVVVDSGSGSGGSGAVKSAGVDNKGFLSEEVYMGEDVEASRRAISGDFKDGNEVGLGTGGRVDLGFNAGIMTKSGQTAETSAAPGKPASQECGTQ